MSPLADQRIVPLLRSALPLLCAALCFWSVLPLAPAAAAGLGLDATGRLAAGFAPLPVQSKTDDVHSETPSGVDDYQGKEKTPDSDQQAPAKRNRFKPGKLLPFRILLPPATRLPEADLVAVPEVIGRAPAEAADLLGRAKLQLREGQLRDGAAGTSEHVVAQEPAAGTRVKRGSAVTVDIALPPALLPVPAIVGMTLQQAIAAVSGAGFSFESKGPQEIDAKRDRIVAQAPAAGALQPLGATVVGEVQRVLVTVPAIVDKTVGEARALVERAELRFSPRGLRPLDPDGQRIADQRPAAGSRVPAGSPVVAMTAPPLPARKPPAIVPDLIGLSRDAAAGRLLEASLRLAGDAGDASPDAAAVVTAQRPAAGSRVPPETEVAVVLQAAPALQPEAGAPAPQDSPADSTPQAATPPQAPAEPPAAAERPAQPAPRQETPQAPPQQAPQAPSQQPQQAAPPAVLALTARDLWWAAGGALLALLALAGWTLLRRRGTRSHHAGKPAALAVKVERDPGAQEIAWDSEPGLRCELHLRTIADRGVQTLVPDQVFEPEPVKRYG